MAVPLGSEVATIPGTFNGEEVDVSLLAEHDYEPFSNPYSPAFEFQGDVIRIDPSGNMTIDRDVTCISSPGRVTTIKGE